MQGFEVDGIPIEVRELSEDRIELVAANPNGPVVVQDVTDGADGRWDLVHDDQTTAVDD